MTQPRVAWIFKSKVLFSKNIALVSTDCALQTYRIGLLLTRKKWRVYTDY